MKTTNLVTTQISKLMDDAEALLQRRARARRRTMVRNAVATGLETLAVVSLARRARTRPSGRAAALLAGAYLTHRGRHGRGHH